MLGVLRLLGTREELSYFSKIKISPFSDKGVDSVKRLQFAKV